VRLGADATAPAHEHRLLACRLVDGQAHPVAHLGSAMLRGLAAADGFAVLPPGGAGAGTEVDWLALP
jgi:molybdopterin molybdotransferase